MNTSKILAASGELHHWLQLRHCPHIGTAAARKLLDAFGNIAAALNTNPTQLRAAGLTEKAVSALSEVADEASIQRDIEWAQLPGNHILSFADKRYPARLRSISDAPLVLYVRGDIDVLHTPQLALVGSRKPTPEGRENARQFARHIAARGITITSGLALGIDAAGHEGALSGGGLTLAVAATGLDRIYPAQHRELAERLLVEGAIVSEFPVGTHARPEYFPRRNRIISALSVGVLVIEAAVRSGSLTTAKHAMEQGREVFAIPGSIHSPLSRGCHQLIKQGAKLVELADDVFEEIAAQLPKATVTRANATTTGNTQTSNTSLLGEIDSEYQQLIDCFDKHPQDIDTLIERSGLPAADVASMLLMLELNAQVVRLEGGKYTRGR